MHHNHLQSQDDNTKMENDNDKQINIEVHKYRKMQATTNTKYIQGTKES